MEHSKVWFVIIYAAGLCFLGALVYMGALVVFGSHDPETINNYKDCISSDLPPYVCDLMYPPLPIQAVSVGDLGYEYNLTWFRNVNWSGVVPFP